MTQSIRELIDETRSLEVDDEVVFTDETNTEHTGRIVGTQHNRYDDHDDWLVKSTGDTPDSVLELWFDPEGGPVHVTVSFKDQPRQEVKKLHKTN